jgi:HEAT repeat protein
VLASASHDTESAVALQAMFALAEIGTPEAIEAIVPLLASRNFGIVKTAVGQLGRIGATSTAPLIADRLLRAELSRNVDDGRVRDRIPILAEVLVTMRYTERIDALSEAAAKQTDSKLVSYLDSLLARLAAIRDLGDDVDGWISQLSAADPSMRQLAYEELARIGVPKGLDALVALFPDASVEDREAILRSVVDRDAPQVRALVRGILADGEYDDVDSRRTRDLAAWVARQLGGDELIEALRQEIERRHAQDSRVLIYYGLAAGPAALPTFAKHRIARWRYHQVYSGEQQRTLDRLARNLRRGTSTDWIDVRPDWIDYNRFK